jgi:hypothetical protein
MRNIAGIFGLISGAPTISGTTALSAQLMSRAVFTPVAPEEFMPEAAQQFDRCLYPCLDG